MFWHLLFSNDKVFTPIVPIFCKRNREYGNSEVAPPPFIDVLELIEENIFLDFFCKNILKGGKKDHFHIWDHEFPMSEFAPPPYTCIYAYIIKVGQDQKVSCKKSGAKLETQILTFSFGGARLDNPPQRLQIFIDSYNFLALYWAWLGPKILTFFSIVRCCLRVDPRVSDIAPPV